jgi:hypothetical protein
VAFVEDQGAYPVMVALAACTEEQLITRDLPPISKVTLQPGLEPVMDYVGNGKECGEIIVNMLNAFPYGPFPNPSTEANCGTPIAYTIEVGIFRCAPPMRGTRERPRPPLPEEQLESTRLHLADMAAVHAAIRCCMKGFPDRSYVVLPFQPYGPSGGVVGGTWGVVVDGA